MKSKINFSKYMELAEQLEIKTGKIVLVEDIPKATKLIKLSVDFGDRYGADVKTVVTNIKPILGDDYKEKLEGKNFLFVTNLEVVVMMGIESHAMILPGEIETGNMITVSGAATNIL